ncbi:PD-(D/E)XK nuclease family protein [archaeon]|nr:PD-(D/E)XK nuclease family protein [archaeon]
MPKRVQSPSSINLYKQCPRRYFYQYILKYPTKENIHTVRGNVVHEALEKFFDIDTDAAKIGKENYHKEFSSYMKRLFDACWSNASPRFQRLGLASESLEHYQTDSMQMLANWLNHFFEDIKKETDKNISFDVAFQKLKPISLEKEYKDNDLMVRGFIDVVHQDGEDIILMDYKTSKSSEMKEEYLLQLGIYATLYEKEHGKYPKKVGLWFLKDKPVVINVTPKLIKDALFEVEQIHIATDTEKISEYPKKESGLCKFSTGQCDFYDICTKQR